MQFILTGNILKNNYFTLITITPHTAKNIDTIRSFEIFIIKTKQSDLQIII